MNTAPPTQNELFPEDLYPEAQRVLPDLRKLIGQDKIDAIKMLVELTETGTATERLRAANILGNEAYTQCNKYQKAGEFWSIRIKQITMAMIDEYRLALKRKMITKHIASISTGTMTAEAAKDFLMLDNLEKNACFMISSAIVIHKDCKTCRRACTSKSKEMERPEKQYYTETEDYEIEDSEGETRMVSVEALDADNLTEEEREEEEKQEVVENAHTIL